MANTYTTNASLPKPIDEAQIFEDLENLQTEYVNAMDHLELIFTGVQTAAAAGANSSQINTGGKSVVYTQHLSTGSIATITGCISGKPFTLICQSNNSYQILDAGNYLISAAWAPDASDTITLVWDGTRFYELTRANNG